MKISPNNLHAMYRVTKKFEQKKDVKEKSRTFWQIMAMISISIICLWVFVKSLWFLAYLDGDDNALPQLKSWSLFVD